MFAFSVTQAETRFKTFRRIVRWVNEKPQTARKDHCSFDCVTKLADIAGPRVPLQRIDAAFVDRFNGLTERHCQFVHKRLDKGGNVFDTLT